MDTKEFLITFAKLETELENLLGVPHGRNSFVENLKRCSAKAWMIKKNQSFLREVAAYRNLLSHSEMSSAIAYPTESTIRRLKDIVSSLAEKKSLSQFFSQLRTFDGTEALSEALSHMQENDFSQIVVVKGGSAGILSADGIASWLIESLSEDIISLKETSIASLLRYEPKGSCGFVARNASYYDAAFKMQKALKNQIQRVHAILITQNGKAGERPIGIITPWDLMLD